MDLGYGRVPTVNRYVEPQIGALQVVGIDPERIYCDKKSGSTFEHPGLVAVLSYAPSGDVVVVHTLDRLGRTVRDTPNMIHELAERGGGARNFADPVKVESSNSDDPMAQLAVVLLVRFAQMERTYMLERAAHARAWATTHGRQVGRPTTVNPNQLDYARWLRDEDATTADIVAKTGFARSGLYRRLPRPPDSITAEPSDEGISA